MNSNTVKSLMAFADEYAAAERAIECATDGSNSEQERATLEAAINIALNTHPSAVREAVKEAALWLHAAYDRPPQSPECVAMLARIDAALTEPMYSQAYTHADVTDAHAKGYALGLAQKDRPQAAPSDYKALISKVKRAINLADNVGRSRGPNSYAMNDRAVSALVALEIEIEAELRAALSQTMQPQAAQPAGQEQAGAVVAGYWVRLVRPNGSSAWWHSSLRPDRHSAELIAEQWKDQLATLIGGAGGLQVAVSPVYLAAPGAAIAAREQDGSEFLGRYAEAHELDVRTIPASREEAPATPKAETVKLLAATMVEVVGTGWVEPLTPRRYLDAGTVLYTTPPDAIPAAPSELTDAQIDSVFSRFAKGNDNGTPWLRSYQEGFRNIARAVLALTQSTTVQQTEPFAWAVVYYDGTLATKDGIFTDKEKARHCCDYMNASFSDMNPVTIKHLFCKDGI